MKIRNSFVSQVSVDLESILLVKLINAGTEHASNPILNGNCCVSINSKNSFTSGSSYPEYGTTNGKDRIPVGMNTTFKESNPQTAQAIQKFLDAGITTNIHFVLTKMTIIDALIRLKNNLFPKGINAVVFLTKSYLENLVFTLVYNTFKIL